MFGLILSLGTAFGQAKINGTVVSQDDGEAVIGASVMVQGTTTGTVTDIDGHFTIDVPAGKNIRSQLHWYGHSDRNCKRWHEGCPL